MSCRALTLQQCLDFLSPADVLGRRRGGLYYECATIVLVNELARRVADCRRMAGFSGVLAQYLIGFLLEYSL